MFIVKYQYGGNWKYPEKIQESLKEFDTIKEIADYAIKAIVPDFKVLKIYDTSDISKENQEDYDSIIQLHRDQRHLVSLILVEIDDIDKIFEKKIKEYRSLKSRVEKFGEDYKPEALELHNKNLETFYGEMAELQAQLVEKIKLVPHDRWKWGRLNWRCQREVINGKSIENIIGDK